jgi:hypothetical protein
VNFAYILYLRGRLENMPAADLERLVRRWYAMSILRRRYSGSPETAFDLDIRQIGVQDLDLNQRKKASRRAFLISQSGMIVSSKFDHSLP